MSAYEVRQFRVSADDDGIRLDRGFKRHMAEATYTVVAKWARTGQLRVDGNRATPGDRLQAGQTLRVPPLEPAKATANPKRERPPLSDDPIAFAQRSAARRLGKEGVSTCRSGETPSN